MGAVRHSTLIVANIGDSRCILGRHSTGAAAAARAATANSSSAATGGARGRADSSGGGRAMLSLEAVSVSDDHKPDRPDEQRRILARGGRVFAVEYDDGVDGPPRVWLAHMDIPGLAMSR